MCSILGVVLTFIGIEVWMPGGDRVFEQFLSAMAAAGPSHFGVMLLQPFCHAAPCSWTLLMLGDGLDVVDLKDLPLTRWAVS